MPRFDELDDRQMYPAGDLPPEEDVVEDAAPGHADPEPSVTPAPTDAPAAQVNPDWEERYKQLERKLGEQGNELGQMRQQNQELQSVLETMQAQPGSQEQALDLQTQLQGIREKLDEGDLSPDEALFETAQIVSQMSKMEAEQIAEQRFQKFQQETEADRVLGRFHEQHPDFEELRQTGTLEEVKKQLPGLHDDFSAYYAYKAQTAADEAYERGKSEMEKLAQGDAAAGRVLSKPGNTIRQKNQQPLTTDRDVKDSMLQRLRSARGG